MLSTDGRVIRAFEAQRPATQSYLEVSPAVARDVELPGGKRRLDFLTLGVAFAVYGGFCALTAFFRDLPLWLAAPLGSLLLAWYGSLQHETIHGHPTSSRRIHGILGGLPLSLWIPYTIYREPH